MIATGRAAPVDESATLAAAVAGDQQAFRQLTAPLRRQLLVHCYQMLGSLDDAEDAVQETLLKAWRHLARFEQLWPSTPDTSLSPSRSSPSAAAHHHDHRLRQPPPLHVLRPATCVADPRTRRSVG